MLENMAIDREGTDAETESIRNLTPKARDAKRRTIGKVIFSDGLLVLHIMHYLRIRYVVIRKKCYLML